MPYGLKNRVVLVVGGSRGLGALVVEKFAAQGCRLAINYNASENRAEDLRRKVETEHGTQAITLQGDASSQADCERIVQATFDHFKGLDVIISNAGWTKVTKFGDLNSMSDSEWDKCWSTNCKAHLYLFRKAVPIFDANPDGGVFILTASIAGVAAAGSSMAYAVSKAASLHLVKCLAATHGPKIRVNAVSPGLLLTEWTVDFLPENVKMAKDRALLKKETDLDDTAESFLAIARNSSLTGQNVQVDSGFAMLGRV